MGINFDDVTVSMSLDKFRKIKDECERYRKLRSELYDVFLDCNESSGVCVFKIDSDKLKQLLLLNQPFDKSILSRNSINSVKIDMDNKTA